MPFSIQLYHPHAMTRRSHDALPLGKYQYDATWYCRQHNRNLWKICNKMIDMSDIEFEAWKEINRDFVTAMIDRLNKIQQLSTA